MKKKLLKIIYIIYAFLAKVYIKKHKPIVIGITGSVGKTSCRMIVFQVFRQFLKDKKIYTSPKNFNSELGLVFSIFKLEKYNPGIFSLIKLFFSFLIKIIFGKKQYDILVLEYGVDMPGDMVFLLKIVKPDYSIFTKLDYIHVANFSGKEQIGEEKIKLIKNTKEIAYLNKQDQFLDNISEKLSVKNKFFNKKGEVKHKYLLEEKKIIGVLKIGKNIIKTNILGEENFIYISLAMKLLKIFGVDYIKENTFIKLINQPGRFTLFNGINDSVLIDSTYNAGPASMFKMIENTIDLQKNIFKKYKIIFVIGDMRELGEKSKIEHLKLFSYLKSFGEIISVGEQTKKYFGKHLGNFKYSREAGLFLIDYIKKSDDKYLILFKGSQTNIYIEEALKQVLKNEKSIKKLVRQEKYWIQKKQTF